MVKVYLREDEQRSSEKLGRVLRKFKKMCDRAGISRDIRKHEFYDKPSEIRKRNDLKNKVNFQRKMRELESGRSDSIAQAGGE
jgi:small subunit ribosomal protein S21